MPESAPFSGLLHESKMLDSGYNNLQGPRLNRSTLPIAQYDGLSRRRACAAHLARAGVLLLALLPLGAGAIGFGKARALSQVGQPLRVEIPLLGTDSANAVEVGCFKLIVPKGAGGDDIPWLPRANVDIVGDVAPRLRVTTSQPVPHPILMLAIHAGCGMEVTRAFTLLLEAPPAGSALTGTASAPATPSPAHGSEGGGGSVAGRTLRDVAQALYPDDRRRQQAFIDAQLRANPDLHEAGTPADTIPLPPGARLELPPAAAPATRAEPAARHSVGHRHTARKHSTRATHRHHKASAKAAPADAGLAAQPAADSGDRLNISAGGGVADGGDGGLRMATELTSLDHAPPITEKERALLRQEQRLLEVMDEQTSTQMMIEDKIHTLESALADLRRDARALAPQAVAPAAASTPGVGPAVSARPPAKPVREQPSGWHDWLLGGAIGMLVAGLVWVWRRRSRPAVAAETAPWDAEAPQAVPAAETATLPDANDDAVQWAPALDLDLTDMPASRDSDSAQEEAKVTPSPSPDASPLPYDAGHALNPAPSHEEQDSVIELADIMLSFGRSLGAAQTLSDFIKAHPKQGVKPWLKLLEVYRHAGMREEFTALAPQLNQTFNVRVQNWDEFGAPATDDSLENYPHIMTRLNVSWGEPEALDYLQSLLTDNRDGLRIGFSLSVIGEILLLIAIQRAHQQAPVHDVTLPATASGLRLVS